MFFFVIVTLSVAVQFFAAGMALLLARRRHCRSAWSVLAAAFFLMGVRRTITLTNIYFLNTATLDPVAEGVSLLISVLMVTGVWKIRGAFDAIDRLRVEAEEQIEKRKKVEMDLTVSLMEAEDTAARLRESEERLRFLGDNLEGALLYQIDTGVDRRERRFTHVSSGVERIHELTVKEAMESPFAIYAQMGEEDCQSFIEREKNALESESLFRVETRIKVPSGKTKWIQIVSVPRRTPSSHLVWDGFVIDITVRKQLEEELLLHSKNLEAAVAERTARLQHLAAELVQAEQRERRRLSDILHDDLQQVLVGAKFVAERLWGAHPADASTVDARRLIELMGEALKKTRSLSSELSTPVLYEIGLAPALRQLAGQLRERYGFDVTLEAESMPEIRQEDLRAQLFHSVRELLFNAVKHSGTKAACVRGSVTGGIIELSVIDAGKGFDCRVPLSDAMAESGCGLFSIRERIGALGGTLTVDSAPGRGTRVTIRVPVPPGQVHAPQAARAFSDTLNTVGSKGRARVMVVDDHEILRQGVVALLSGEQTLDVVAEAADGREAVSFAKRLCPDVIVMDVRMPQMGGVEATRQILAEQPEVIVIGLSAFTEEGFKTEMLNAGAADLLDKVDAGEKLTAKIAQCLAMRSKTRSCR